MPDYVMKNIFPVPVMITEIGREFTSEEKEFVNKSAQNCIKNQFNVTSRNVHVLDEPEMKDIKEFILSMVKQFVEVTENPKYEHEYYITNSWFNFTNPGEAHHQHKHQNSFVTGVLYLNAHQDKDTLELVDNTPKFIQLVNKGWNPYNSRVWKFKVKSGQLYLFRSDTFHQVPKTDENSKHTRISLAFNTFIRGDIGSKDYYTELKLR